jgi:anthranilate 3-monooxygenase (FAD)/4-hydroxyphenylacetate 3-monooxygenase
VLQTLGAGGLLMMPSAADFASPVAADVHKYYQGAGGMPALERVRLFKLAWDLAGDAFGMRQLQYERYYAGDPVRLLAGNYLSYDKAACRALVERALSLSK